MLVLKRLLTFSKVHCSIKKRFKKYQNRRQIWNEWNELNETKLFEETQKLERRNCSIFAVTALSRNARFLKNKILKNVVDFQIWISTDHREVPGGNHRRSTSGSPSSGNPCWRGRLSTVDLLIKMGCFVKKENIALVWKAADLEETRKYKEVNCTDPSPSVRIPSLVQWRWHDTLQNFLQGILNVGEGSVQLTSLCWLVYIRCFWYCKNYLIF